MSLNKYYKCLVLFFIVILGSTTTFANNKGCIAVFHNNIPIVVEVDLPPFVGEKFNTAQFHFKNLPLNMQPNKEGKYCYSLQDERFAFVHTYYYAVSQIESYNQIFKILHLPLPKSLVWELTLDASSPSGGHTGLTDGAVHYPYFAVDPTTIAHELGHWIAFNAMQKTQNKNHKRPQLNYKINKFIMNGPDSLQEAEGVDEGSANILGSLYTGTTIQGATDSYDLSVETINNYVRIPDLISSVRYAMEQIIESPKFSKRYPNFVADIKKELGENKNSPFLDFADPYATSAVINQPLWQAATRFGANKIKLIYIDAMAQLINEKDYTYADLAHAILNAAEKFDPEIKIFLQNEFVSRGIKL